MKTSKLTALALIAITTGLTGCGQSFQAASNLSGSNSSSSTGGNGASGISDSSAAFKALSVDGTFSTYPETQVIEIDKANLQLIVRLPTPLPLSTFQTSVQSIPQIPGATVTVEELSGGGSALVLRLPLSAIVKGIAVASPSRLPNGDPLPGVADGELPSFAVYLSKVGQINPTIYLGPSVVGIYLNSPTEIPAIPIIGSLTLPIKNAARTRTWGFFSAIPAKGTDKGGFYISLALPDDIARIIDDVL
jgi:hypothetical protein